MYIFRFDRNQTPTNEDSGIFSNTSLGGSFALIDSSAKLTSTKYCLSNSERSPSYLRSSSDHELERSLSIDDDSGAYYTAHSDESCDAFLDSGYFQLSQELDDCTTTSANLYQSHCHIHPCKRSHQLRPDLCATDNMSSSLSPSKSLIGSCKRLKMKCNCRFVTCNYWICSLIALHCLVHSCVATYTRIMGMDLQWTFNSINFTVHSTHSSQC